jgi:hypothetical protein
MGTKLGGFHQGKGCYGCCNPVNFTIYGCGNIINNVDTLTLTLKQGATAVASGSTSSGMISFSVNPGAYTIVITGQSSRFASYSQNMSLACGSSYNLTLSAGASYCCSTRCVYPIADTLNVFFAGIGSFTFTCSGFGWLYVAGGSNIASIGTNLNMTILDPSLCPGSSVSVNLTSFTCPNSFAAHYTITGGAGCTTATATE